MCGSQAWTCLLDNLGVARGLGELSLVVGVMGERQAHRAVMLLVFSSHHHLEVIHYFLGCVAAVASQSRRNTYSAHRSGGEHADRC